MSVPVRRVGSADAAAVARILAEGFMADPVSRWLLPDDADRARRHEPFFRVFVDHALAYGTVYRTDVAAALWFPVDPAGAAAPPMPAAELAAALGPSLPRLEVLGELTAAVHPQTPHSYLPLIAALPGRHGSGHGTALLAHHLATLPVPAYLEASNPRSMPLYARFGFAPLPDVIRLPDGPTMRPMWRPAPPCTAR